MKPTLFAAALLTAGSAHAAPPVITITTPAQFSGSKAIISGTATDTEESTGGGGTGGGTTTVLGPGGVREVLYQYEGESKWRKTTVTAKGELTTTWIAEVSLKVGSTKRIYFMAVDKGGNDGEVVGRKFKRLKKGETGGGGGTGSNNPPTFTVAAQTSAVGSKVSLQIIATDADNDKLTYSASASTGLPAGLVMNSTTGLISGTVTEAAGAVKTVSVTVSDGKTGGAVAKTFVWTIVANRQPVIGLLENRNSTVGTVVTNVTVPATDDDGDELTFSAPTLPGVTLIGLPPGLIMEPATGKVTGTISGGVGTYTVGVLVTDRVTQPVSKSFTWIVTDF